MAIKVIVELRALPGRRQDVIRMMDDLVAAQGPAQRGFLGSARYEAVDDPDVVVELADWESAEARQEHMREAAATGAYAPLMELLAAPIRVTVVRPL